MKYNKQLVLCVETRDSSKTDKVYINETISRFFDRPLDIHIEYICMRTKTKYNSKEVKKEIDDKKAGFVSTTVIYFIDTDNWDSVSTDKMKLNEIRDYCSQNGYEFVFFCKDIEDVYWGKRINKKDKVPASARFRNSKVIYSVKEDMLIACDYRKHSSNILTVLGKYLNKKK